ncbi:hypothetical protein HYH02_011621 [Chlamydomonas schloesseri]|uniref:J domain-containing protein n=1 Tax=Chlamydomonas schloesseri TaxID=2026947 RepID=A0A835T2F2_9CHLO|nr:hypothetical protein HYH02_011621 [Chlamydomonas schloesseri]|eukprot:KAG2436111.1 hypothetical protein HYH02_011621 [Chlamydomonas schloesseri]
MSQRDVATQSDDTEYYAILNIPRDASDEDVRRAYRALAQVYHPDKHSDPEQKIRAQEAFGKLQEAYEVLSDPNRRQVYDVYGKEGLLAGFEVGTKLDSVEEMKKKWEEFKRKQDEERAEQLSNHRGTYTCRIDLSDVSAMVAAASASPSSGHGGGGGHLGGGVALRPLFRAVAVTNSIDTPVGDNGDVVYIQGQAALRNNAGLGNLIFGYRRVLSQHDTLEGNVVLGLRSALALTSTRQVTPYTTASLTTSYAVGTGVGMQLSTTRHLPFNMQATLGWVVGPPAASALTFSLTKRGTKYIAAGKLELGGVTSLSARLTYHWAPDTHLRAIARLGTSGVDLELGAGRKWGPSTTGYLATVVGLQGVAVKGRLVRGGQTFEVPVVVSHSLADVRLVAAAYLLPPLTVIGLSRFVVRPLVRWQRRRKEQRERQEHCEAIRSSLAKATAELALIEPVARRKARSEAARRPASGLVILDAVYGATAQYLHGEAAAAAADGLDAGMSGSGATSSSSSSSSALTPQRQAIAAASAKLAAAAAAAAAPAAAAATGAEGLPAAASTSPAPASATAASAEARPQRDGTPGASASAAASSTPAAAAPAAPADDSSMPPPPWLSVTAALQYQVADSRLQLHPGVPKKNQMGFADPTPGSSTAVRRLYVAYLHGSLVYEATCDDLDGLALPGAGEVVWDAGRRQGLLALGAAALGCPELLQPPQAAGAGAAPAPGSGGAGSGGAGSTPR